MEAILRISSSVSTSWVSWIMLVLLLLNMLNRFFVEDMAIVLRGMFSYSDRSYIGVSWSKRVTAGIYRVGVLALVLNLLFMVQTNDFVFVKYLLVMGIVVLYFFVQQVLARFVALVFLSSKQRESAFEQRMCISNAVFSLLWPCALLMQWISNANFKIVICCVMAGFFLILLLLRAIQMFGKNVLSYSYVLLYIITLEVVPLMAAIFAIKHTI